ncbi:MAG: glycosyltransferase [Parcubacteria group bacterium]|nr:glycosyltransferase [Parcubacteria group bacterium]
MSTPKLSIIVPAYNEEKTVGKVLKRLLAVPFPGWTAEVTVVNDASTDGTLAAMKVFSPRIRIINLPKKQRKRKRRECGTCRGDRRLCDHSRCRS